MIDEHTLMKEFLNYRIHAYTTAKDFFQTTGPLAVDSHAFRTLYALTYQYPDGITMKNLAAHLGISKQQLTKLVADLIHKGWILKMQSGDNKRSHTIMITQIGTQVFISLIGELSSRASDIIRTYSLEQKESLYHAMHVINSLLDPT